MSSCAQFCALSCERCVFFGWLGSSENCLCRTDRRPSSPVFDSCGDLRVPTSPTSSDDDENANPPLLDDVRAANILISMTAAASDRPATVNSINRERAVRKRVPILLDRVFAADPPDPSIPNQLPITTTEYGVRILFGQPASHHLVALLKTDGVIASGLRPSALSEGWPLIVGETRLANVKAVNKIRRVAPRAAPSAAAMVSRRNRRQKQAARTRAAQAAQ
jgi:hypothetical protein